MLPFPPYRFGNPAAMAPGFIGPLDAYSANLPLALSVTNRLLSSYTGYAFNVLRSTDSTSQDIGFNADGTVNTTALLAFCGAGNGTITKIYNQGSGGSALDAAQSLAANQPRIVNAGVLDDGTYFNANRWLDVASQSAATYTDGTNVQVALVAKTNDANKRIFDFANQISCWLPFGGSIHWDAPLATGRISVARPAGLPSSYKVTSLERAGGTSTIRYDGSALTSGGVSGTMAATSVLRIGATGGGTGLPTVNLRTLVLWKDCTNAATRASALP